MKTLFFETIYGVEQIVFNVGDNGDAKTHRDPITGVEYAYASAQNVKRNLKECFSNLSGIQTPKTEFKKNASAKNGHLVVNGDGDGEQGGVSVFLDQTKPNHIASIFGAWASDISDESNKYVKASLKSCINVSDMMPVHPLLQRLSKNEVGVFVGDKNSAITLGDKNTTLRTPEEAAEFAGCSIDEAKKVFSEQRPMNMFKDKKTANGVYQETFAIDIEAFGKIKLSSCTISEEAKTELIASGWRIVEINGEEYLSPTKEDLLKMWGYLVDAMLSWDFSSNNSLHGNVKEPLRYSVSLNGSKIKQCNSARVITNEDGRKVAELVLRDHDSVMNFNTTSLEKWYDCKSNNVETSLDADEEVKAALIKLGEENIL